MSDQKLSDEEFVAKMVEEASVMEKRKKDLAQKELVIRERRVEGEIDRLERNDKDLEIVQGTDYSGLSDLQIAEYQKNSREYLAAAKKSVMFINKEFDDIVPFFRKNLILI